MIDHHTIERIRDAADIVDVVKEFVSLRKAGVNYKGLCPFHNEKTPSFVVSPAKNICHCFSCGKGGDSIHFLMEIEQMSYTEAIKWLGRKYGIEVREKELTDEEKKAESMRESMFAVNEWARDYFEDLLHNNPDGVAIGMAYFRSRGLRDDIIRKFQLGYSLEQRDALAATAVARGFNKDYLLKTGLCFETDDHRLLDRYHGRVIFPVHSVSGKIVAFGGRILGDRKDVGKYVNSPESEIYSKSRELYGLYQAKKAIVKENRCYMVEGYMDVISMHQSGVENVVASSGTSLTEGQIRLLHRFTDNITVLYDGDAAGIKASIRGIDMLLAEGLNIKVLLLPDGDDPDSFARKHNAEEFQRYIDEHQVDFIKFKTDLLLEDAAGDPIKRAALVQDVVRSVSVIPDNVVRQMYIHECATRLSEPEELIVSEINKLRRAAKKGGDKPANGEKKDENGAEKDEQGAQTYALSSGGAYDPKEEASLLASVVRYGHLPIETASSEDGTEPSSVSVAQYVSADLKADGVELSNPLFRRILEEATDMSDKGEPWDAERYFSGHVDPHVSGFACRILEREVELCQTQKQQFVEDRDRLNILIPHLLHDLKHAIITAQIRDRIAQLRKAGEEKDDARAEALMQEIKELTELERAFAHVLGDRVVLR